MDTFARNALRISLAGAGILVLGATYVDQASADEAPDTSSASDATASDATAPVSLPTIPAPEYLLAPSSLDTFVLPTVSDAVSLPEF